MRMSEDNARRLNRLLWWQRIRKVAAVTGLALMVIVPYLALTEYRASRADLVTTRDRVAGTVLQARPSGRGKTFAVDVQLTDGRQIEAISVLRIAPIRGTHVLVDDVGHKSGRHSYVIARIEG